MEILRFKKFNEQIEHNTIIYSSNFKKWFGDWENVNSNHYNVSQIVDENGKPVVVYHGTKTKHSSFNKEKIGSNTGNYGHYGFGFYFTFDEREAESYSSGGEILRCYLNIRNPFKCTNEELISLHNNGFDLGIDYEILSTNQEEILDSIKKKYPIAAELYSNIINFGYTKGWEAFIAKYPNVTDTGEDVDLNDISDLYDIANDEDAREFASEMGLDTKNYKFKKGFRYTPDFAYLTNLGEHDKTKEFTETIIQMGYDGVIYGSEIVAFEPNQIKSIDNKKFTDSDDIYENII